jgi:glutaredoxin 3
MSGNTEKTVNAKGNPVKETNSAAAKVVMYGTPFCPYCMFARRLFKSKGVEFTEIKVSGSKLWDELELKSGRNTVPQIFINDESLGGYDDIAALDSKGELDQKLGI